MLVPRHELNETMNGEFATALHEIRARRGFDAAECLARKVELINNYCRAHKLSGLVVGVSGGIDSAVVLGLVSVASRMEGSPISRIVAASLPFFVDQGASDQDRARDRAKAVAKAFNAEFVVPDLSATFEAARRAVSESSHLRGNAWADGQLVAYLRTPALYYLSALLSASGTPAIVCGTTNRDEGSYLGFFGKASDGMVDLQIISDLHKSEVYRLGELLKVPMGTLGAAPTGDVYDGKTHLEMIGAPYDFVELYTALLCLNEKERTEAVRTLSPGALRQFEEWGARIEEMHRYNLHKYVGGNPSVHLSIYERAVPGGWREEGNYTVSPTERRLVGEFLLNPLVPLNVFERVRPSPLSKSVEGVGGEARVIEGLLSHHECEALISEVSRQRRIPVGTNGYVKGFTTGASQVGSWRATVYSPELAARVWERMAPFVASPRTFDEYATTDWGGHAVWRAVGVNPAFRFIWYENGGELVVHYDAGFNPGDGATHTLMSLVLYLNECDPACGGRTRFITDPQLSLPYAARDFSDWTREARDEEVIAAVTPTAGRALIFDHRLLHDSEPWSGRTPKVIIRTDVLFEKVMKG